MNPTITWQEFTELRAAGSPYVLIDTHTPEDFRIAHLPGACNACVYEMSFLDTVAGLVADRRTPVIVYGSSERSRAGAVAMLKLIGAGYTHVQELTGGLEGCRETGVTLEPGDCLAPPPPLRDGLYRLDPAASRVEWAGRNFNNRHYGTVSLSGGEVKVERGLLTSGRATVDLASMVNLDLKDEVYNRMLISHLKSDDFFDVGRYPVARFRLTGSEPIPDAPAGAPGLLATGTFELKGTMLPLVFPVGLAPQEDGSVKFHAILDLDRTRWGVIYGSGRFFERLGMHLVSDIISLELFLTAHAG